MLKLDKIGNLTSDPSKKSKIAVVHGATRLTWGDLEHQTRILIAHFAPKNYHRVVFLSENRAELIALFSTFSTLGIPFVGIDYTASLNEKIHCAREIKASCLIYAASYAEEAGILCAELNIDGCCLESDLPISGKDTPLELRLPQPRPFESIMFTSGTTGFPKAVFRSKSFEERRFAVMTERFGFNADETFIATIPFFHGSVTGWARLFLSLGGKIVITEVDNPDRLYMDIIQHGVTCMLAPPHVLDNFVTRASASDRAHRLKFVIVGGKVLPVALKQRALNVLGPIVNEYYGTSETGMNVVGTAEDLRQFPESSGRVLEGSKIAILDPSCQQVREGEVGRVAIASYQNMDRYLNHKTEFLQLEGESYVLTADCGYLVGDRLFLLNRALVVHTDFNLYGIENDLRAIPGVVDVCAVAVGPRAIQVFIVKDYGPKARIVEVIRRYAGDSDVTVRLVPSIPYGMSGKVQMLDLLQTVGR